MIFHLGVSKSIHTQPFCVIWEKIPINKMGPWKQNYVQFNIQIHFTHIEDECIYLNSYWSLLSLLEFLHSPKYLHWEKKNSIEINWKWYFSLYTTWPLLLHQHPTTAYLFFLYPFWYSISSQTCVQYFIADVGRKHFFNLIFKYKIVHKAYDCEETFSTLSF